MRLSDFKASKQRELLKQIGETLISLSEVRDDEDVELILDVIQTELFEGIQDQYGDFWGTEGWDHLIGIDE